MTVEEGTPGEQYDQDASDRGGSVSVLHMADPGRVVRAPLTDADKIGEYAARQVRECWGDEPSPSRLAWMQQQINTQWVNQQHMRQCLQEQQLFLDTDDQRLEDQATRITELEAAVDDIDRRLDRNALLDIAAMIVCALILVVVLFVA